MGSEHRGLQPPSAKNTSDTSDHATKFPQQLLDGLSSFCTSFSTVLIYLIPIKELSVYASSCLQLWLCHWFTVSSTRNFLFIKWFTCKCVLREGLGESTICRLQGKTNLSQQQQEKLASFPSKESRVITRSLPYKSFEDFSSYSSLHPPCFCLALRSG